MNDSDYQPYIREGVPSGWALPATPTPGQTYAAFGDTSAASGDLPGLSPAMQRMVRRALGTRLGGQTMEERQQTAERAARGAALMAPSPLAAAGTMAATSIFMGDSLEDTAGSVAQALLPSVGGRVVGAGLRYAPKLTAALAGGTTLAAPALTESEAADRNAIRLERLRQQGVEDEARRAKQTATEAQQKFDVWRKDPNNVKALEGFSPEWQAQIRGAKDLDTANSLFLSAAKEKREAEDLRQWKRDNANEILKIGKTFRDRIALAKNKDEAKDVFDEGARSYKEASSTWAENNPNAATALELSLPVASAVIPGVGRMRQLRRMDRLSREAETSFDVNFGRGAGTPTEAGLRGAENAAGAIRAQDRSMEGVKVRGYDTGIHPGEIAGGTVFPYVVGTLAPSAVDYMLGTMSTDPGGAERAQKAWDNATDWHRIFFNAAEGFGGSAVSGWTTGQLKGASNTRARALTAATNLEREVARVRQSPPEPPPSAPVPPSTPAPLPPGASFSRRRFADEPAPSPASAPFGSMVPPLAEGNAEPPTLYRGLRGASARSHYQRIEREHPGMEQQLDKPWWK